MAEKGRRVVRQPATKFAQLRKKMEKNKRLGKNRVLKTVPKKK